jgi:hypothetical protein
MLLFAGMSAMGLGRQEKKGEAAKTVQEGAARDSPVQGPKVRITGRLRMVGNSPFSELVISTEDREWYIDKKDEAPLRDLQQQIITVEGTETSIDLIFANGTPAGRRYTLRDVILIN